MTLDRLKQHVAPAASPVPSDVVIDTDGRTLALPPDYAELMAVYGPGAFDGYVFLLSVDNPRRLYDMVASTRESAEQMAGHRERLANDWPPYPLWPAEGALVKWATIANEHDLFWLTKGEPSHWPVVVLREDEQLHELVAMTATEFLVRLIEGPEPSDLVGTPLANGVVRFLPSANN
ncbi:hypothetical protein DVA67_025580 [Solirubrobacter sp. CPCC 204708]|uniref:SMI1/KNR4 family protein n=1 Tax=Solirubrobacter deserti TaxID=2282478 RepID=A0ABT4RRI8_9ACTN|nr:hypothetical protein [Solirubrobacter deserti]MBE2319373.1 hypothetical protein [Solirubrobacter deserti]MDA0140871.1 hypothetical protein [Solirubrobacter deserti]